MFPGSLNLSQIQINIQKYKILIFQSSPKIPNTNCIVHVAKIGNTKTRTIFLLPLNQE